MSAQSHNVRLKVRARMDATGEPYTVALRAVRAELDAPPARKPVAARERVRPEAQAAPDPTGLTPAFREGTGWGRPPAP